MKIVTGKNAAKLTFLAVFIGIVIGVCMLSGEQTALASASGPAPSNTNAPGENNCTACHVDFPVNSGSGSVKLSGIPRIYFPGQHIPVTVTTSQKDGVVYGFQLTAVDSLGRAAGTWTLNDMIQTQMVEGFVGQDLRQYVEHTFAGIVPIAFGSKSWTVTWNAPSQPIGLVRFHAAGNAANGNGETDGDFIYTTAKTSIGVSTAFDLADSASDPVDYDAGKTEIYFSDLNRSSK
jgi:Reeler domain